MEQSKIKYHERGMLLTINNGKRIINEPTVSLSWRIVDTKLCLLNPQYMLLVIKNRSEIGRHDAGERHVVKTSDLQYFMQFHRGGEHEVTIMLLAPSVNIKAFTQFITKKDGHRSYAKYLDFDSIINTWEVSEDNKMIDQLAITKKQILLFQTFSLQIPGGLFATAPNTGVTKFFWDIINTGWKYGPVDQCEMRKRTLISMFTPHFYVLMIFHLGVLGVWSFLQSITLVLGRSVIFLIGFRPQYLFEGIGYLWSQQVGSGQLIWRGFFMEDYEKESLTLQLYNEGDWRIWKKGSGKKMLVTPLAVIAMVFSVWYLYTSGKEAGLFPGLVAVSWLAAYVTLVFFRLTKSMRKDLKNERFWGLADDQKSIYQFKPLVYLGIASLTACLLWLPYRVGLNQVALVLLKILLFVLFCAVIFGVVLFLIRLVSRRWEKEKALRMKREAEEQAKWDLFYESWGSVYGVGGRKSLSTLALSELPECDICDNRTLFDRFRLFVSRKKPKVCKPFSA